MKKKKPDPETDLTPLYGTKPADIEKDEDPVQFPGDLRPEWERENSEIADRKPDLEEVEEDSGGL